MRIRDVFNSAIDLEPVERPAFVAHATDGDPQLEHEVLRLLRLSDEAGDFLEAPAFTMPLEPDPLIFSTGEVVAERFEVIGPLGSGGMGDVYEANDRVLGERVALKVMRSSGIDPSAMAARFRQEVQLARRISHPGVCRVHDVAFHRRADGAELIVLTMELLRGHTLAQRLEQGPLDAAVVVDIARQLADALDAAHAQRILHGDIKPANVFLEPRDGGRVRAVLTDFGLARAIEHEATGSAERTRPLIGTPAYMAPEQTRGGESTVQSDLFAFSLVLCEIVAGRPEYSRALSESVGVSAGETPVALRLDAVPMSAAWRQVFARALDLVPERRYGSARDVVDALWPRAANRRASWLRRSAAVAGSLAIVALVVALSTRALRLYEREQPIVPPASDVLVADTVNSTGEEDLDGLTEVLRGQLAQSPHFEIMTSERIRATLQLMGRDPSESPSQEAVREVAMRQGVRVVAYSAVERAASGYALAARLERLGSRPTLLRASWTQTFTASDKGRLFDAVHDAATWIRKMVGESAGDLADQDRPASDTTTSSWDALRLFTKANAKHAAGQLDDAVVLLNEAVRLDPKFATGYMRLGDELISLKRDREGYAAWRKALALAEQRQLTSREYLRMTGQYFEDIGDLASAEKAHRTYVVHYPADFDAAFYLGSVLFDAGRPDEAVTWLSKASQLRATSLVAPVHLATAYFELGRFDLAAVRIETIRRLGFIDWAVWLDGLSIFARGDIDRALQTIGPLRASTDKQWQSRGFTLRASWIAEAGRFDEARAELLNGIAFDAGAGLRDRQADKWIHLAEMSRQAGDTEACVREVKGALAIASNAKRLMLAGTILARLGRLTEAQHLLASFEDEPDVPRVQAMRQQLLGEVRLAQNRVRDALGLFERASALERLGQNRAYLARGLLRSGDAQRAETTLDDIVQHPARLYAGPEPDLPGSWADALRQHAEVLTTIGRADADLEWTRYRHARPSAAQATVTDRARQK